MLFGNPSTNYWNELGVEAFDDSVVFNFDFFDYTRWMKEFPPSKYPVIALKGISNKILKYLFLTNSVFLKKSLY